MPTSERDPGTSAFRPHPFKVGDRVWVNRGRLRPNERAVVASLPSDHTGRLQVFLEKDGVYEWFGRDEIWLNVSPNTPPESAVDHPSHYTQGGIETIDAIEAMVSQPGWSPATGLRLGNVLKYLWRHAAKGGVESLKKARWFLEREIKAQEKAAEKKP